MMPTSGRPSVAGDTTLNEPIDVESESDTESIQLCDSDGEQQLRRDKGKEVDRGQGGYEDVTESKDEQPELSAEDAQRMAHDDLLREQLQQAEFEKEDEIPEAVNEFDIDISRTQNEKEDDIESETEDDRNFVAGLHDDGYNLVGDFNANPGFFKDADDLQEASESDLLYGQDSESDEEVSFSFQNGQRRTLYLHSGRSCRGT